LEIQSGAKLGDSLIVSDVSQFDAVNRIRLE
jgi:hypothetical protein